MFSVSKYDGVIPAETFFGKRVASADLSTYKLLPDQAWVYSTIHIDEGSIARNNLHVDGVVSPMYTVMNWTSSLDDPRYVEQLLRSREMLAVYADNSQGSINRRRSLAWKSFSQIEVELPPLPEQRRIVDLIAAVDDEIDAADNEARYTARLLDTVLDVATSSDARSIGSVATISSGASWVKADVRPSEDAGSPVLTIANTRPGGIVSGAPAYVTGLSPKVGRLTASSVVAIRTNGNRDRIGNVYRVPDDYLGAAVSAFQFIVEPLIPEDSSYLYWMMRRPGFQSQVTRAASGSTGLGNIAAGKLRNLRVPWPEDITQRASSVEVYEDLDSACAAARAHAEALRTLRSNLLTVLLSGKHKIPSNYDLFLNFDEEAAA
ncbi:restriction endonuclease subunit S [Microbacterium murale]|uniref:restriction endonuclease subunit S n=1 Tax=Microbacterium murale TaxID=1081040 RepID=UPI001663609A|nr:restriction endonuclease subunit S [Microbacterium murale]